MAHREFKQFFEAATGNGPFGFQTTFAHELRPLVHVPTGLGKTAMVIVGWLWRRNAAGAHERARTPRRLVYCLPMRVLVEQTCACAKEWVDRLQRDRMVAARVPVQVLMGGEDEDDWDIYPERDAVIIGTQDMLLSRALNRGYAASRSRWPMQFGLLHTDCLWVFDEIQLMGSGLATTAQLEAFRRILPEKDTEPAKSGHGCRSVWMSATMRPDWLKTVDFKDRVDSLACLNLSDEDHKHAEVKKRWNAKKPLKRAETAMGRCVDLAKEIVTAHVNAKGRTIVVLNTVRRACELHAEIKKTWRSVMDENLVLIHSRFRPPDRADQIKKLKAETAPKDLPQEGMICVSTQVIEAGVDVSATTLFTEVAPWASLVQRFGRCNRRGEDNASAAVHWIGLPAKNADAEKARFPYELADLGAATEQLEALKDVGLQSLPVVDLQYEHTHVIRRKDLIDLFDTTPDLAGNDIDIDRFIRDAEETDARVFWRDWLRPKGFEPPPEDGPAPRREELCPARVGEFRDFAKKPGARVWRWNFLDRKWEGADAAKVVPGQVYLVHADAGGYTAERGWDPGTAARVDPVAAVDTTAGKPPDANDEDTPSRIGVWQTIAAHTDDVCKELDGILAAVSVPESAALRIAARWHDWGKAHPVFQRALPSAAPKPSELWAKAAGAWNRYDRRHFRHELASALAVLDPTNKAIPDNVRNLVAYLIATHHGKVRLSIRSLPNEKRPHAKGTPQPQKRFARGVWDGDPLPATDLGGGVITYAVMVSLEPMELGLCESEPFKDQPSWLERTIRLRDTLGPFRLAYLEALLRSADMRASAAAEVAAEGAGGE